MSIHPPLTSERIAEVAKLIRPHVRRTPAVHVDLQDFGGAPLPLALKLECLQHSGSFKARGAFTNLLTREVPAAGVVAASGGNHGAAVAYAAMRLGVPATIFVPSVTSPSSAWLPFSVSSAFAGVVSLETSPDPHAARIRASASGATVRGMNIDMDQFPCWSGAGAVSRSRRARAFW